MLLENCDVENQTAPKTIKKVDKNVYYIRYGSNELGKRVCNRYCTTFCKS